MYNRGDFTQNNCLVLKPYSVKLSSALLSCSVHAIYIRGNHTINKRLVLKPYIPWIDSLIITNKNNYYYSSENIFDEYNYGLKKHPGNGDISQNGIT